MTGLDATLYSWLETIAKRRTPFARFAENPPRQRCIIHPLLLLLLRLSAASLAAARLGRAEKSN